MKKIKKRIKTGNLFVNTLPMNRMSEHIAEYASDYINMGENTEERQSLLNSACSAWNVAVLPEHLRQEALHHNIGEYKRLNQGIDDADNLIHDMQLLIQKKLQMFPKVNKVIVDSFIEPINETQYRINVVPTDDPKQLKQVLSTASSQRQ